MTKHIAVALALLLLTLSGCSALDNGDADLVVVNDSGAVVYSITVDWEGQTQAVEDARGYALLERGDRLGVELEEKPEWASVTLAGENGRELGRGSADLSGGPVRLTLEEGGRVLVSKEEE